MRMARRLSLRKMDIGQRQASANVLPYTGQLHRLTQSVGQYDWQESIFYWPTLFGGRSSCLDGLLPPRTRH